MGTLFCLLLYVTDFYFGINLISVYSTRKIKVNHSTPIKKMGFQTFWVEKNQLLLQRSVYASDYRLLI